MLDGNAIKHIRVDRLKMTQEQLARHLDVVHGTIGNWEWGRNEVPTMVFDSLRRVISNHCPEYEVEFVVRYEPERS